VVAAVRGMGRVGQAVTAGRLALARYSAIEVALASGIAADQLHTEEQIIAVSAFFLPGVSAESRS
jgi:hypothetical protein